MDCTSTQLDEQPSITCPTCGAHEADADGDCVKCHEPGIAKMVTAKATTPNAKTAAKPRAAIKKSLALSRIQIDGETQPREKIDPSLVAEYIEAMDAGAKFPPAIVYHDGADYWLADGFHRYFAALDSGRDDIECEVRTGTLHDARWFSYSANQTHGMRRTNADKAKAVKAALQHPTGAKMSDNSIAEHCGVSQPFVGKIRESLITVISETTRVGRDGREIKTAKIGKGRAKRSSRKKRIKVTPEIIKSLCEDTDGLIEAVRNSPMGMSGQRIEMSQHLAVVKDMIKRAAPYIVGKDGDGDAATVEAEPDEDVEDRKPRGSDGCPDPNYHKSARFAINCADCAITQLAQIKRGNPGREAALERVIAWCRKAMEADA
jgi:hypothetical protein